MTLLRCIVENLTGATDATLMLTKEWLHTVRSTGVPRRDIEFAEVDALVVELKLRSIAPDWAVAQSIEAAQALLELGAQRLLFKY